MSAPNDNANSGGLTTPILIADNVQIIGGVSSSPDGLGKLSTVGNSPAAIALEVQSTTGGVLVPRLTEAERDAQAGFWLNGTVIYNSTDDEFQLYQADAWIAIGTGGGDVNGPGVSVAGNIATWNNTAGTLLQDSGVNISQVPASLTAIALFVGNQMTNVSIIEFVTANTGSADCYLGLTNATTDTGLPMARIYSTQSGDSSAIVLVESAITSSAAPNNSTILEIRSTTSTFLNARMPSGNIASPINGMQIYDSSANVMKFYQNGGWVTYETGDGSGLPYREVNAFPNTSLYMGTGYNTSALGINNLGIGRSSLTSLVNGDHNIAVGATTLSAINNSNRNVAIGYGPLNGLLTQANDCIFIGNAGVFNPTLSNSVGFGGTALGGVSQCLITSNNQFIMGNPDGSPQISSTAYHVGIGTNTPYARLHVEGGIIYKVTNVSGSYSIPVNDLGPNGGYSAYIIGVARSSAPTGPYTIILPSSNNIQGQMFIIKDINGFTGNTIVIAVETSGGTIDGNPTKTITPAWGYIMLYCNSYGQYVTVSQSGVSNVSTVLAIRDVTTDTVILPDDYVINVTDTSAPRTITLPPAALVGESFVVKDGSGAASVNNITIQPASLPPGQLIDGQASVAISINYGSLNFVSDGTNYYII